MKNINVKVHLTAYLANYNENRNALFSYKILEDSTVLELINQLNIPVEEIALISVNNNRVDRNHVLQDNDKIVLIPEICGG